MTTAEAKTKMTKRYCLTLDLKDDPNLIAEYRRHHEKVWPEITKSIRDAGPNTAAITKKSGRKSPRASATRASRTWKSICSARACSW